MAVAVPADVSLVTQYGFVPDDVDTESTRYAYLQLHVLSNAVEHAKLSSLASMYHSIRSSGTATDLAQTELSVFLQLECAMTRTVAQERVRIALALVDLPLTADAFGMGMVSWQQLVYLTQFLTAETEEAFLADELDTLSVMQLKKLAAVAKADGSKEKAAHENRRFSMRRCDHSWKLFGELPIDMGEVLNNAIERIVDAEGIDVVSGNFRPLGQRRADALVSLASAAIATDVDPDLATVVIHVEEQELSKPDGIANLNNHSVSLSSIIDRFCDARTQVVTTRDGKPIGIGRMSRTIPPWLRRLLKKRDRGCRFPNCENTKGVEAHHIKFWRFGGETDIDNLISLCRRHHHLIHDDGWKIVGNPNDFIEFRSPDERTFTARLPQMDSVVREFALSLLEGGAVSEREPVQ